MAHIQTAIVIYVTHEEKADIKKTAKENNKSMSKYLLDMYLHNKTLNEKRKED